MTEHNHHELEIVVGHQMEQDLKAIEYAIAGTVAEAAEYNDGLEPVPQSVQDTLAKVVDNVWMVINAFGMNRLDELEEITREFHASVKEQTEETSVKEQTEETVEQLLAENDAILNAEQDMLELALSLGIPLDDILG